MTQEDIDAIFAMRNEQVALREALSKTIDAVGGSRRLRNIADDIPDDPSWGTRPGPSTSQAPSVEDVLASLKERMADMARSRTRAWAAFGIMAAIAFMLLMMVLTLWGGGRV